MPYAPFLISFSIVIIFSEAHKSWSSLQNFRHIPVTFSVSGPNIFTANVENMVSS